MAAWTAGMLLALGFIGLAISCIWYLKSNDPIAPMCGFKSIPAAEPGTVLYSDGRNTYSDDMTSAAIASLYWSSIQRISAAVGQRPRVYCYEDKIMFPRLKAVWQLDGHYLEVRVAMNNDNDSIWWKAIAGKYDPAIETTSVSVEERSIYPLPIRKD